MSWIELLGSGLVAGTFVKLLDFVFGYFRGRSERKAKAKMEALQLSNELMVLALECRKNASEFDLNYDPHSGNLVEPERPDYSFLEIVEKYTSIDGDDLSKLVDIQLAKMDVDLAFSLAWQTWMDHDDACQFYRKKLDELEADFESFATALRKKHGLSPFAFAQIGSRP